MAYIIEDNNVFHDSYALRLARLILLSANIDDYSAEFGACVYRPGVQVKDNWGWCTGDCGRTGGGCYDDPDGANECDVNLPEANPGAGLDPWIYFNGQVIVTP